MDMVFDRLREGWPADSSRKFWQWPPGELFTSHLISERGVAFPIHLPVFVRGASRSFWVVTQVAYVTSEFLMCPAILCKPQ